MQAYALMDRTVVTQGLSGHVAAARAQVGHGRPQPGDVAMMTPRGRRTQSTRFREGDPRTVEAAQGREGDGRPASRARQAVRGLISRLHGPRGHVGRVVGRLARVLEGRGRDPDDRRGARDVPGAHGPGQPAGVACERGGHVHEEGLEAWIASFPGVDGADLETMTAMYEAAIRYRRTGEPQPVPDLQLPAPTPDVFIRSGWPVRSCGGFPQHRYDPSRCGPTCRLHGGPERAAIPGVTRRGGDCVVRCPSSD